jgi:WD40 repeat protein
MDDGMELHSFKGPSTNFSTVAFLLDGRRVVAANGSKVQLYNVVDFKDKDKDLPSYLKGHENPVWFAAVSPGGHRLLTSGQDKYFCLWDIESGKLLEKYTGHTDSVPCVVWTPDGTRFVSGSKDGTIRVWAPPRNLYDPPQHPTSQESKDAS